MISAKECRPASALDILIVDDHFIFRNGLKHLIKTKTWHILEAANGEEAIRILETNHIDVVLMDMEMPVLGGIPAAKIIYERFPHVKVIAMTAFTSPQYVQALHHAGVSGFLLKDTDLPEIQQAIHMVSNGKTYYCEAVSDCTSDTHTAIRNKTNTSTKSPITEREAEILCLICQQFSVDEISRKLFISTNTVKRHKQNLFEKTNSKNLAGLTVYAIEHRIYK